jgi:hypothetical protein
MPRVTTPNCSRRIAWSGNGTASCTASRSGERSCGSTDSGWLVVHTTAAPDLTVSASTWRNTVASGPGWSRGATASTSTINSTAGALLCRASWASPRSRAAAASLVSAASSGAHTGSRDAPTSAATARTRADLPEPAGPEINTPSDTVVPSRPSTSR